MKKPKRKKLCIYAEGGGDTQGSSVAHSMREGFKLFFKKAGFTKPPGVTVCGTRRCAYDKYRTALCLGKPAMLLLDSEAPIQSRFEQGELHAWKPWEHLKSRTDHEGNPCDNWEKVGEDTDCHLMVQTMEAWFFADVETVKAYFGTEFKADRMLAQTTDIEAIPKEKLCSILEAAASSTKKETYKKGRDSFVILGKLDPMMVRAKSKWAERFLILLEERIDSLQD